MREGPTQNIAIDAERVWRASPALAFTIRAAAFLIPLVAGWLVVMMIGGSLFRPEGTGGLVLWMAQAVVVASATATVVDQWSRRLLPLAALYGMSLVFPDQAPSRFGVALRLGSTRKMEQRLADLSRTGLGSTEREAAESAIELVTMLSSHDRLTRGHSERVRAYCDIIAEELAIGPDDRNRLAWAALLHDVGKLQVPAAILTKDDSPTEEEWNELARHPVYSERLLEPLAGWLGPWIGAATEHHERWDGDGYPRGIRGQEISLAGRIAAVADAFDTLTSSRSYKKPVSPEVARKELVECAGTQFDPAVVRAFVGVSLGRVTLAGPFAALAETPGAGLGSNGIGSFAAGVAASTLVVGSALFGGIAPDPPGLASEEISAYDEIGTPTSPRPRGPDPAPRRSAPDGGPDADETTTTTSAGSIPTELALVDDTTTTTAPGSRGGTAPAAATSASAAPPPSPSSSGSTPRPSPTSPAPAPPTAAPTTAAPPPPSPTTTPPTTTPPTTSPVSGPTLVGESLVVKTGRGAKIEVLANDTFPGSPVNLSTLSIVGAPSHASEYRVHDDHLHYRSVAGYLGGDTLTYRVCNTAGSCSSATVTLTVVP